MEPGGDYKLGRYRINPACHAITGNAILYAFSYTFNWPVTWEQGLARIKRYVVKGTQCGIKLLDYYRQPSRLRCRGSPESMIRFSGRDYNTGF